MRLFKLARSLYGTTMLRIMAARLRLDSLAGDAGADEGPEEKHSGSMINSSDFWDRSMGDRVSEHAYNRSPAENQLVNELHAWNRKDHDLTMRRRSGRHWKLSSTITGIIVGGVFIIWRAIVSSGDI